MDVLPGHLEVLEEIDEEDDEYSKQRHAARKRQMTAGRSTSSPDKVKSGWHEQIALCTACVTDLHVA